MRPAIEQIKGKNLIGAEIGVWRGTHAIEILNNLDIKKLYLVDPYKLYYFYKSVKGYVDPIKLEEVRVKVEDDLRKAERKADHLRNVKNVQQIKKMSHIAVKDVKEELDFVYIDGNHAYEYVLIDILTWLPKIKKGGLIGGHDFNDKEVAKAVTDMFPNVNSKNRDWWIRV